MARWCPRSLRTQKISTQSSLLTSQFFLWCTLPLVWNGRLTSETRVCVSVWIKKTQDIAAGRRQNFFKKIWEPLGWQFCSTCKVKSCDWESCLVFQESTGELEQTTWSSEVGLWPNVEIIPHSSCQWWGGGQRSLPCRSVPWAPPERCRGCDAARCVRSDAVMVSHERSAGLLLSPLCCGGSCYFTSN